MTDKTPDTKQVRMDYAYLGGISHESEYDERTAGFDRWLAEHDREVKTRALREAALDWEFPTDPGDRTPRTGSHAGAWLRGRAKAQEAQG